MSLAHTCWGQRLGPRGSMLTLLHESPKQNCIGGCQCPPRLRSSSTTLSKEWNDLTSDYFFFTILCVLSLRYIQEQVSKMGINIHTRDQVHVSVKKKSTFLIWPKEISLFLPFAKDYLQFRISFTFTVRKISRKVSPLHKKMHLKWALPASYSQLPRSK